MCSQYDDLSWRVATNSHTAAAAAAPRVSPHIPAVLGIFSLNAWMPIIIKNMLAGTALQDSSSSGGSSESNTLHDTLLATIPYFCAAIGMWLNTWSAVRLGERTLHVGVPCIFGGVLLALFEPLYRAAFAAGFAVLAIAIACPTVGKAVCLRA
jgi:hypothetical protein